MYPCAKIRIIIETAKLFLLFLHLIIYTRDFLVSAGRNFVYGLFFLGVYGFLALDLWSLGLSKNLKDYPGMYGLQSMRSQS